jgi:hypothetical protein
MGCGCGKGGAGRGGKSDTLGYYVQLPDVPQPDGTVLPGATLPHGVNPDQPEKGEPPFMLYAEAHLEVVTAAGGTVHRLKRKRSR